MSRKLGVFNRKQRTLIIDLVEAFSSNEPLEFTIDELREDYKLNTDQVLACIMFVNRTANQSMSA